MNLKKSILFLTIFFLGFFGHSWYDQKNAHCGKNFDFINPRFACGERLVIDKKDYIDLKSKLISYIEDQKKAGKLEFASVYFRDLEAGPTMGIDQFVDYIPASLLKVPLVLTYLALAEDDSTILSNQIIFGPEIKDYIPVQNFKPSDRLVEGNSYTVDQLIERTIINSDNASAQILFEYLDTFGDKNLLSQTYRDLGIIEMGSDLNKEAVNTKSYGSIFRILYNSSFLNPEASEKFLKLLSQTEFKEGLEAGVPSGVVVAHKFGERSLENGQKQLHDCGIIYFPDNPYLLCIMTRGNKFEDLAEIISHISAEFYKEVESRRLR